MNSFRNTTVDPLSQAEPVSNPEILEVLNLRTGQHENSPALIASFQYDKLIEWRGRIKESIHSQPLYACSLCPSPVYLVASKNKKFFFRHLHEDGSCKAVTRGDLNQAQIRALKYQGIQQSEAHKRIKNFVEMSLRADPFFVPESIQQETRIVSSKDNGAWRQPDVQAETVDGTRFVFEVQLSTTFLDVVIERKIFYLGEKVVLIWLLGSFESNSRKMTEDDLLFSNNSNVFIVDEATARESEELKRFRMRCAYRVPIRQYGIVENNWKNEIIDFSALKTDADLRRTFYFDYDSALAKVRSESLPEDFASFWRANMNPHFDRTPDNLIAWHKLTRQFSENGVILPDDPGRDSNFRCSINAVLSAKSGSPVGWQYDSLIQVAHLIEQQYPHLLLLFGYALAQSPYRNLLSEQDRNGRWKAKMNKFREKIKNYDPDFRPSTDWLPLISFLFPEVAKSVYSYLDKAGRRLNYPPSAPQ